MIDFRVKIRFWTHYSGDLALGDATFNAGSFNIPR